jgi:hypothetical protein
MRNWKEKVRFRDLLSEYNTEAEDELKEVERFEGIGSLRAFVTSLKVIKTELGFNKWLNRVYDYCDLMGIWIEM